MLCLPTRPSTFLDAFSDGFGPVADAPAAVFGMSAGLVSDGLGLVLKAAGVVVTGMA